MVKNPKSQSPERNEEAIKMREAAREGFTRRTRKPKPFYEKYAYHLVIGGFLLVVLFGIVNALWKSGPNINTTEVNDASFIASRADAAFQVAANPAFDGYKLSDAKLLFNNQASNKQQLYRCQSSEKASIIPDSYNFRVAHPECARPIINQGNCSASYSIAAVSAVNDRFCLQYGASAPVLSAQAPIACDKSINSQCKGGFVSRTLDYAKIYGLVEEKCLAYDTNIDKNYDCQTKTQGCDRYKISDYCVSSTEEGIKQEILNHGPVVAVIPVYRDFLIYKSGSYEVLPKNQRFPSGHAVKIIGWDVIDGKKCWLVENSWGAQWGQEGIAHILIGQEELDIERFTLAPSIPSNDKEGEQEEGENKEEREVNLDEFKDEPQEENLDEDSQTL